MSWNNAYERKKYEVLERLNRRNAESMGCKPVAL